MAIVERLDGMQAVIDANGNVVPVLSAKALAALIAAGIDLANIPVHDSYTYDTLKAIDSNTIGKGVTMRDAKDYGYAFTGEITTYAVADAIQNNGASSVDLAIMQVSDYKAETSEFKKLTIGAGQDKVFPNYNCQKMTTKLADSTIAIKTTLLNGGVANGEILITPKPAVASVGKSVVFTKTANAIAGLSCTFNNTVMTVNLATSDDAGTLDNAANTATLVAAAINANTDGTTHFHDLFTSVVATGGSAGGTGAGVIGAAAIAASPYAISTADVITTPTLSATLHFLYLQLKNACTVALTNGTILCPTRCTATPLAAGSHIIAFLGTAAAETITLTSVVSTATTPVSGISDGDSGFPATNIANRVIIQPHTPMVGMEIMLVNN